MSTLQQVVFVWFATMRATLAAKFSHFAQCFAPNLREGARSTSCAPYTLSPKLCTPLLHALLMQQEVSMYASRPAKSDRSWCHFPASRLGRSCLGRSLVSMRDYLSLLSGLRKSFATETLINGRIVSGNEQLAVMSN